MATIFSIPIDNESNEKKEIYSLLEKLKELQYKIEKNWDNLPDEEKERLINYYYKFVDKNFTFWEKFKGSFSLFIYTLKYGFQPVLELANEMYNLLNLISDKIEQENPEYRKFLKEALKDNNTETIGNIDEFIKSLDTKTNQNF
ncbi:MAG: hypothetical protein DSY66_03190 [Persephonella sp.]|nr:MAG: hypothetical protein DSY66_03190 [Persephonella sp.]